MRKKTAIPTQIALRVTTDVLDRADALAARVSKDPKMALGTVTRSNVLRLALLRGLESLEAEYK